jgi:hypothetical protein
MPVAELLPDNTIRRSLFASPSDECCAAESRSLQRRLVKARSLINTIDEVVPDAEGEHHLQLLLLRSHLDAFESVVIRQMVHLKKAHLVQSAGKAGQREWTHALESLHVIEREHRQALDLAVEGVRLQKQVKGPSSVPKDLLAASDSVAKALGK